MTTFTILKFPTTGGAQRMLRRLKQLQEQHLIQVEDGAILTWPPGVRHPRTRQLNDLTGVASLGIGFWEMLFCLLFSVPVFGATSNTAIDVLTGHFVRCGIDEEFLKGVHNQITEDTSALFLLTSEAVLNKVAATIKGSPYQLMFITLSYEQEARLRDIFCQESLVY